jgi:O-antigen/teichoic acid export membrane protein
LRRAITGDGADARVARSAFHQHRCLARPEHGRPAAMTLRTLVRGSAVYAAGNMLARVGGFVLLPIYLQLLTRSEYGLVALVTSLVGFLGIVYRLGLDGALMRLHFDTEAAQRAGLYRTLLVSTLGIAATMSIALALLVSPVFETIFFGVPFAPYGILALAIAFVGSADYVPSILYRSTRQPSRFLAFNLSAFAVSSAFSIGLVAAGFGAAGALLGQLIGGAIMLGVAVLIATNLPGRTWLPASLGPALRFGVPLVPHQISTWTMRLSDRWLLGLLLALPTTQRLEAIGAYSVGYQLGSLVTMVSSSFNLAWTPYLFRIGDTDLGPRIFRNVMTITTAGLLWMALGLSAFAPEIIAVIASPDYGVAAQVLPVVAFAAACQAVYTMLVGIVFLRRETKYLPMITVASAVANVGLNLLLIPRMGVMGAAVTTFVAYAMFAALTFVFARRIFPLDLDVRRIAAVAFLCVVAALAARLVDGRPGEFLVPGLLHGLLVLAVGIVLIGIVRAPAQALRRDAAGTEDLTEDGFSAPSGTIAG